MRETIITSNGIKKALKDFSIEKAIGEVISNGFDAGATIVRVVAKFNEFNSITELSVIDNGNGIPFENLKYKFEPFFESEKSFKRKEDNIGLFGKNGYGRLTFFKFAQAALWQTTYKKEDICYQYEIKINADTLNKHDPSVPQKLQNTNQTGTTVVFSGLNTEMSKPLLNTTILEYLKGEFSWFLELNKSKGFKLIVDDYDIDPQELIAEKEIFEEYISIHGKSKVKFQCKFILWKRRLIDEYSRFYFVNEEGKLKHQRTTKLNNKGDQFYHSLIVESVFFNGFVYEDSNEKAPVIQLFSLKEENDSFRELVNLLNQYLKKKRKPFLHKHAETLIKTYEEEKVMPEFGKNKWDEIRKDEFQTLVKELYEVEPALFVQLNTEQKKTFLLLLNLLLDSDERESLFKILEGVVDLDTQDRKNLERILSTTKLHNIVKALRLVHDRIIVLEKLKQVVFDHTLKANEIPHLQKIIEEHYWIFGEEYAFVCAAEVNFEEALRRYLYLLRGEKKTKQVEHPNRLKQMDLFITGQNHRDDYIENVVIEIKNPSTIKTLSSKQLQQLENYKSTILEIDEFNASNYRWRFYLIGQDYDNNIAEKIENSKPHGEKYLVTSAKNYRLYVLKWSEVINDLEIRLKWLSKKLQIERAKLVSPSSTIGEVMVSLENNSAAEIHDLPKNKYDNRKKKAAQKRPVSSSENGKQL